VTVRDTDVQPPVRGVVYGLLLALPFWLVVAAIILK
jgi:hypothetical protein